MWVRDTYTLWVRDTYINPYAYRVGASLSGVSVTVMYMVHQCSVFQNVAVRCSVLQCVAVCCSVLMNMYRANLFPIFYIALCYSVLQCVAVGCSVLQCVNSHVQGKVSSMLPFQNAYLQCSSSVAACLHRHQLRRKGLCVLLLRRTRCLVPCALLLQLALRRVQQRNLCLEVLFVFFQCCLRILKGELYRRCMQ